MSWRCWSVFHSANTTMYGPTYVELLKEKLNLHKLVHGYAIFMQYAASYRRSKVATELMKKKKIVVLEWPGNCLDLNPIENLWTTTKDKVPYKLPSSAENLMQAISEVWVTGIGQEYCQSLASSMPRRIQAVNDSTRGYTKY